MQYLYSSVCSLKIDTVTLTVRSKYTDFFYLYHERGLVKRLKNFNLKLRHKTAKILYNMLMEHEGYSVLQAADGRTALELFESDTPDILLLDIMLPQLNGLEVLWRIRKTSSVPVIMLTARGETFDKVSGLDSGADDYLAKPFEIEASNLDERLPVTDKGMILMLLQRCLITSFPACKHILPEKGCLPPMFLMN